jgi:prevent-host-death family protein
MKMVNIPAAKTHLSRLVEEATAGEEIVLAKAGRPMVRLVPCVASKRPRKLGALRGKIEEIEGCWEPDPDLEKAFRESNLTPQIRSTKIIRSKR